MSVNLHVAEQFKVKYALPSWFRWGQEQVNMFLFDLADRAGVDILSWDNENFEWADDIEFDKDSWKEMIRVLRKEDRKIAMTIGDETYSSNDIADIMGEILAQSDPDNDFIHLEWF